MDTAPATPARPARDAPRLEVTVVTPEGAPYEGGAYDVVVPAHDGEVAFYPGHAPFVAHLGMGTMRIRRPDGTVGRWYLEGGVVQVLDDAVTVLGETVTALKAVDVERAREDLRRAGEVVPVTDEEVEARDRALESARARLRAASAASRPGAEGG